MDKYFGEFQTDSAEHAKLMQALMESNKFLVQSEYNSVARKFVVRIFTTDRNSKN